MLELKGFVLSPPLFSGRITSFFLFIFSIFCPRSNKSSRRFVSRFGYEIHDSSHRLPLAPCILLTSRQFKPRIPLLHLVLLSPELSLLTCAVFFLESTAGARGVPPLELEMTSPFSSSFTLFHFSLHPFLFVKLTKGFRPDVFMQRVTPFQILANEFRFTPRNEPFKILSCLPFRRVLLSFCEYSPP